MTREYALIKLLMSRVLNPEAFEYCSAQLWVNVVIALFSNGYKMLIEFLCSHPQYIDSILLYHIENVVIIPALSQLLAFQNDGIDGNSKLYIHTIALHLVSMLSSNNKDVIKNVNTIISQSLTNFQCKDNYTHIFFYPQITEVIMMNACQSMQSIPQCSSLLQVLCSIFKSNLNAKQKYQNIISDISILLKLLITLAQSKPNTTIAQCIVKLIAEINKYQEPILNTLIVNSCIWTHISSCLYAFPKCSILLTDITALVDSVCKASQDSAQMIKHAVLSSGILEYSMKALNGPISFNYLLNNTQYAILASVHNTLSILIPEICECLGHMPEVIKKEYFWKARVKSFDLFDANQSHSLISYNIEEAIGGMDTYECVEYACEYYKDDTNKINIDAEEHTYYANINY